MRGVLIRWQLPERSTPALAVQSLYHRVRPNARKVEQTVRRMLDNKRRARGTHSLENIERIDAFYQNREGRPQYSLA